MKTIYTLTLLIAVSIFSTNIYAQSNCIASPEAVEVQQPDGTKLMVIGKGNMALPYMETTDGYTLLQDANGYYKYALPAPDGNLVPSGILAKNKAERLKEDVEVLASVPLHARYVGAMAEKLMLKEDKILHKQLPDIDHNHNHHDQALGSFPNKGQRKALLILIEYPDLKSKYTVNDFDSLMNAKNYNGTGSFKDYYRNISNDSLNVEVDVVGWFMASNNYDYYGRKHSSYGTRVRGLVAQAVDSAAAAGVDFSKYDNDGDGNVDGIFIVHSGPGAEEGSRLQYVWSHRWSLAAQRREYNNVNIDSYIINPETRTGGINERMVGIGIFCHEFGHLLGLPDLYDTDTSNGKSEGVGNWCLMGGGSWLNSERTPAIASAWSRETLGWNNVINITEPGNYTVQPSYSTHTAFKITTANSNEYFLLENRQKNGFDKALPGRGLAIWHINKVKTERWPAHNDVNADATKKGVGLKEADGNDDLDNRRNRGDAGDLYPGLSNNTTFDYNSYPSSALSNGSSSGIIISNITLNTDSTITFTFGALPVAKVGASALSVCEGNGITFTSESTYAEEFEWDFAGSGSDTSPVATHIFNNSGQYYVKLKVSNVTGFVSYDSVLVNVLKYPVPDFDYEMLPDFAVKFNNKSEDAFNYKWDFGIGGGLSYFKNPSYTFPGPGNYEIKLSAFNSGCGDSMSKEIKVYDAVGFSPYVAEGFNWNVFPNPVNHSGQFSLYLNLEKSSQIIYRIIGMDGRELKVGSLNPEKGESINNLSLPANAPSGIYMLQLNVEGSLVNTRLSVIR